MGSVKFTKGGILALCLGVLAIAVVAISVFKVSVGNLFFYAILLACPLLHLFMMRGHGDHKNH